MAYGLKSSGGAEFLDLLVEESEDASERTADRVGWRGNGGPGWAEDSQKELGTEEGDPEAKRGDEVTMGA